VIRDPRGGRPRPLVVLRPVLLALALFSMLAGGLAPAPVAAATPDLTLVTNATYVADPASARVAVGVDIVATNHKSDTQSYRYYFDNAYLAVLPNASGFSLTASGASPSVAVARKTSEYTLLHLVFGGRVYSGKSLRLHLAFDLRDKGGLPTRDVRVGQALIQFPVWAFATDSTPGSSVTVVIPGGYAVQLSAGQLNGPAPGDGGTQVLTSGALGDPLSYFAYVTADRPGAYAASTFSTTVDGRPAPVEVDAWPDDSAWGTRVADIFRRGLPVIGRAVGLPYPRTDALVVRESVSRTLGGYAGIFDPATGRIDVDYAASPFVILHEASHVWFNGSLLADRWANEAFATYYGQLAAKALGVEGGPDPLTPALLAAKIPLNSWGAVGQGSTAVESYAYAASAVLATKIADRAGAAGLQAVWAAASDHESAYQSPSGPLERTDSPPDWRGLLDLLEERTGKSFDDLWTAYVIRPTDAPILAQRTTARSDYAALLVRAADWHVPASVRKAMSAWQFDAAEGLMGQAGQVLDKRAAIVAAATAAGLAPPSTLQRAFESDAGFPAASAEADTELRTIGVIRDAAAARPAAGDAVVALGLVGSDPDADMAAARAAFATGDLSAAVTRADLAQAAWQGARDAGVRRGLSLGAALLLVLAMATLLVRNARARRQRWPAAARAGIGRTPPSRRIQASRRMPASGLTPGSGPAPPDPYATLAPEPPAAGPADGGGGEGSERT
jgi:hypothetical protein